MSGMSSAGNTRGLIEAMMHVAQAAVKHRLPRGIPAASLKQLYHDNVVFIVSVFRGEYPRPH